MNREPHLWKKVKTTLEADCRIFKVNRVTFEHEERNKTGDFFVLNTPSWVHVIALTPDDEIVMAKQFRFGTENLSWELPGGLMEEGETPIEAAQRELREETGFVGCDPEVIAAISPNPAIQNNTCYFVLLRNATREHELDWDEHEEILTSAIPVREVEEWAHSGKILHSLSITSLFFLQRYR
jgi:ADP-ribose pyrophosphatase